MFRKVCLTLVTGGLLALVSLAAATSLPTHPSASGVRVPAVLSASLPPFAVGHISSDTPTDGPNDTSRDIPVTKDPATQTFAPFESPAWTSEGNVITIPSTSTRRSTRRPAAVAPVTQLDPARQRILDLTNAQRAAYGLAPLHLNQTLINSASWMANDLAARNVLSHVDSFGRNAGQRIEAFGYPWYYYGENVGMGFPTPDGVVAAWMASPDHRANILNPHYTEIGVGHAAVGNWDWWSQDFGTR